jgi:hypothetical protein
VVPEFGADERLYLRYEADHWVQGELTSAGIRFPDTSVNRSRFSEPEDVLFSEQGRYNRHGVVFFPVSDIPVRIALDPPNNGNPYLFRIDHKPLDDNYSHSEIRSRPEGTVEDREPSKTIKKQFRIQLCQRLTQDRVLIEATENEDLPLM